MNLQDQNHFVSDVIKQSLGKAPEMLPADFHRVADMLPRWHLLMLKDKRRLEYYSEILKPKVKDKIVLDVGTGSGVLSYLALKWGAKKVYSIEENPALQAVYRHLMKEHIQSGKAELISDDAQYLRLDQFKEGAPDVIVHELFGAFGMGENLIPIFRGLSNEGILTEKTIVVPDALEVWVRPVFSDVVAAEAHIEAFEGYGLNEMDIFGHQVFWEQDYLASRASAWKSSGDSQLLFRCDLRVLKLPDVVTISFKATDSSHIKLWMKIFDTQTNLIHENDHQELESHWNNTFLSIPLWLRGKAFQVEFKIHPDKVEVLKFIKT